ncbi:MAG: hypothetical protein RLZZ455_332 [Candidatus Parcubacteria bacterium]|jgi:type IV secretory pathway VirB10-like protein
MKERLLQFFRDNKFYVLLVLGFLILTLIIAAYSLVSTMDTSTDDEDITPTPTKSAKKSPTPTEEPEEEPTPTQAVKKVYYSTPTPIPTSKPVATNTPTITPQPSLGISPSASPSAITPNP